MKKHLGSLLAALVSMVCVAGFALGISSSTPVQLASNGQQVNSNASVAGSATSGSPITVPGSKGHEHLGGWHHYMCLTPQTSPNIAVTPSTSVPLPCQGGPGPCAVAASSAILEPACIPFGRLWSLIQHFAHAEVVAQVPPSNSWVTFDVDRGTVSVVSSSSITINRPDGVAVTADITSQTKYFPSNITSVSVGQSVVLVQKDKQLIIIASFSPVKGPLPDSSKPAPTNS